MSHTLTAYRVFIASPGGLTTERQAFRDMIQTYNEMDAIPRGLLFIPVGWEATLPGMGRPQSLINEDLRECDYFILVLWDRWGSASGDEKYTSATSEEYSVARQCCQDPHHSLREIAAFFKSGRCAPDERSGRTVAKRPRFQKTPGAKQRAAVRNLR